NDERGMMNDEAVDSSQHKTNALLLTTVYWLLTTSFHSAFRIHHYCLWSGTEASTRSARSAGGSTSRSFTASSARRATGERAAPSKSCDARLRTLCRSASTAARSWSGSHAW